MPWGVPNLRVGSRAWAREGRTLPGGAQWPGREAVVSRPGLRAALWSRSRRARAARRRPTLAGNVFPGDAAPVGERGAAAAAVATVRASAACKRTCGAAGGGGARLGATGGRWEVGRRRWQAGRRRPLGSRTRARCSTKSRAAPRRYRACPGPRGLGGWAGQFAGDRGPGRAAAGTGLRGAGDPS